jgi:hypothetical protein
LIWQFDLAIQFGNSDRFAGSICRINLTIQISIIIRLGVSAIRFGKTRFSNSIRHARFLEGTVGGKATLVTAALVARREFNAVVSYTK